MNVDTGSLGIAPCNGVSHVKGATDRPLINTTLPGFLAEVTNRHGDRLAAVFSQSGERWSYRELAAEVDRLAAGLLAIGLSKGDRVGIWSPNRPEWLLAQFATARIGIVLVNINPAYKTTELEYALNKVTIKGLILAREFKTSAYVEMLQEIAPEMASATPGQIQAARVPTLSHVIQLGPDPIPGAWSFDQVMGQGDTTKLDAITATLSPHDPINIQFTSGTTGAPKGATLTHYNIVNNGISVARAMKLIPGDVLCIPVPLYHCFGMVLGNLAAMAYGVTMVFPGEGFDPVETLTAVTKMGAEEVTIAYGMTETSPVSFQTSTDDPFDKKTSTVGRIQPHCECKIIRENGTICAVDEPGELLTRGYVVMQGYWNDEARTTESIVDGWMHTGDIATFDAQGYCKIVGRIKDMIIRGGENIYPAELEDFLLTHPDIAAVQVFGLPDEKYGEQVAAWVIPHSTDLTQEAIQSWCKSRIAHFKVPHLIRVVDEFPLTATGKPQKFKMIEAESGAG